MDSHQITALVEEGWKHQQAGRPQDALRLYQQARQMCPQSAPLLHLIAEAYKTLNQPQETIRYLEEAVRIEPSPAMINSLGEAYAMTGRFAEFLDRCIKGSVGSLCCNQLLEAAKELLAAKSFGASSLLLKRAGELNPASRELQLELGRSQFWAGNYPAAEESYVRYCGEEKLAGHELVTAPFMRVKEYCLQKGSLFRTLLPEEPFDQHKMNLTGAEQDESRVSSRTPEVYVAELSDADIFGQTNFVLSEDGKALYDLALHPQVERYDLQASDPYIRYYSNAAALLELPAEKEQLGEGILLSGLASHRWSHWLAEYAPLFWSIDQLPEYDSLPLIVDQEIFEDENISAMFERLNSRRRPVIKIGRSRYNCSRLILPSRLSFLPQLRLPDF